MQTPLFHFPIRALAYVLCTVAAFSSCDSSGESAGGPAPVSPDATKPVVLDDSGKPSRDPLVLIAERIERDRASAEAADEEGEEDAGEDEAEQPGKRASFAGIRCPQGAKLAGAAPPKGNAISCVKSTGLGTSAKHGPLIRWDKNGSKRYEANFKDDELDGEEIRYYPGEQPLESKEYRNGVLSGRWSKWNKNGEKTAEGHFSAGKKNGTFRYWDKQGSLLSEGPFRDNVKSGVWSFFNRDGALKERITFGDGKKNGKAEKFYANGRVASSGGYKDNKPDGKWTVFHENGHPEARGEYVHGKKDGTWTHFDENGRPKKSVQYSGGTQLRGGQNSPPGKKPAGEAGFVEM